jgi:multidrug efflux pump subunit AcrA (membrane-fusion protein)
MWVLADVYEPDVPKVRLGEAVRVTLPCCPQDRYKGKIVHIGSAVDKDTRTLKARAVVPNPARPQGRDVRQGGHRDGLVAGARPLPQSAIQRVDGSTFVLLEKGQGEYEAEPVENRSGSTGDRNFWMA